MWSMTDDKVKRRLTTIRRRRGTAILASWVQMKRERWEHRAAPAARLQDWWSVTTGGS